MRWKGQRESENVDDRRGVTPGRAVAGGGIGVLVIAVIAMLMGQNPLDILSQTGGLPGQGAVTQEGPRSPQEEERAKFAATVLANTEDVWNKILPNYGKQYRNPTLVLFTGQVESACGFASAAVGPFYCGEDEKLYIDLSFFDMLQQRFGAPGEFAQAYVIAHEVGHHMQKVLGTLDKVHQMQQSASKEEANALSVRLELQADFYAGVWAHHADQMADILDPADIEDGLRAASAIGDDTLQKEAQGYVVPESFTHGTSAQRMRWFKKGLDSGDLRQGDTFSARQL
ncbi:MAG TPA: neutral zinc metallopeptidase [Fimbriimonadaceae bacterium]|nr:neutral zinc metallopeptidase [Fimbriimonadaceae bacterium]